MERQFTLVVEKDPESGWLVGEIVELPGCYTQAPTLVELEKNIKEAIQGYLKALETDDPPPEYVGTLRVEVSI